MALTVKQKERRDLAAALLEADGKQYDTALDEFHQEIIENGQKRILEGLKKLTSTAKEEKKQENAAADRRNNPNNGGEVGNNAERQQ